MGRLKWKVSCENHALSCFPHHRPSILNVSMCKHAAFKPLYLLLLEHALELYSQEEKIKSNLKIIFLQPTARHIWVCFCLQESLQDSSRWLHILSTWQTSELQWRICQQCVPLPGAKSALPLARDDSWINDWRNKKFLWPILRSKYFKNIL